MESRIQISVDFENKNRPVIKILQKESDDVRDSLVHNFINHLDHTSISRWVRLEYMGEFSGSHSWQLVPITSEELPAEVELMQAMIRTKEAVDKK
jgi:hypothetical protein